MSKLVEVGYVHHTYTHYPTLPPLHPIIMVTFLIKNVHYFMPSGTKSTHSVDKNRKAEKGKDRKEIYRKERQKRKL